MRGRQTSISLRSTSPTMVGFDVAPTAPLATASSSSAVAHESFQYSVGVVRAIRPSRVSPVVSISAALDPQRTQVVAVGALTGNDRLRRVRRAEELVLLDDEPTGVILRAERLDDGVDAQITGPELAEHTAPERLVEALASAFTSSMTDVVQSLMWTCRMRWW